MINDMLQIFAIFFSTYARLSLSDMHTLSNFGLGLTCLLQDETVCAVAARLVPGMSADQDGRQLERRIRLQLLPGHQLRPAGHRPGAGDPEHGAEPTGPRAEEHPSVSWCCCETHTSTVQTRT